jgi:hypothetical protein
MVRCPNPGDQRRAVGYLTWIEAGTGVKALRDLSRR